MGEVQTITKADLGRMDLFYMLKNILGYEDYDEETHLSMTTELNRLRPGDRLLTLWPRGTFKSTTATVGYPLFRLAQAAVDPKNKHGDIRILIVGYSEERGKAFLREIVGHLENVSSPYRKIYRGWKGQALNHVPRNWVYGSTAITLSSRRRSRKEPTISVCGLNNIPTGMHYDLIICDDVVDPDNVQSPAERAKTLNRFRALIPILQSRTPNSDAGILLVIGTRWHAEDLYGEIKKKAKGMNFRVSERSAYVRNPVTGKLTGELAFPKILNHDELKEHRNTLGSYLFACNYLNDPTEDDTKPFQTVFWRDLKDMPPDTYEFAVCCDANDSLSDRADYTCLAIVAHAMHHHLLFVCRTYLARHLASQVPQLMFEFACEVEDLWMKRLDFRAKGFDEPYFAGILGEQFVFQTLIINELSSIMTKNNRFLTIVPLPKSTVSKNSKMARVLGLKARHDARGILFNAEMQNDEHMKMAVSQYLDFPAGHDDFPDALSQVNRVFFQVLKPDDVIHPDRVHKTAEELLAEYEAKLAARDRELTWAEEDERNQLEEWLFDADCRDAFGDA